MLCLVYLFASMFVFPVLRFPSLTLCVFSSSFSLRAWWSSFSPFSRLGFLRVSVMQAHSHLHPRSHPVPPPHSSLRPLRGFVLLPQCQGPGDEVTLHRRAAGLTEPPPSRAQRTNRPAASPPPSTYICPSSQATTPLRPCKPHTQTYYLQEVHICTCMHACKLVQITHTQVHTVTHTHNCTDCWKLLSSLIPSAVLQPVPCCLFSFLHPSLHPNSSKSSESCRSGNVSRPFRKLCSLPKCTPESLQDSFPACCDSSRPFQLLITSM